MNLSGPQFHRKMKEKGFCLLAEIIIIININDKRSMLENLVKKKKKSGQQRARRGRLMEIGCASSATPRLRINQVGPQTSRAGGKVGHFK